MVGPRIVKDRDQGVIFVLVQRHSDIAINRDFNGLQVHLEKFSGAPNRYHVANPKIIPWKNSVPESDGGDAVPIVVDLYDESIHNRLSLIDPIYHTAFKDGHKCVALG